MTRGFQIDELEALPLPMRAADRLVIGRGGDLYRMDLSEWRGGGLRIGSASTNIEGRRQEVDLEEKLQKQLDRIA